jgi:hypothetical protein
MPKTDENQCIGCKKPWEEVERAVRARSHPSAQQGEPLPRCVECHGKRRNSGKSGKCKREDSDDLDDEPQFEGDVLSVAGLAGLDLSLMELSEGTWNTFRAGILKIECDSTGTRALGHRISALIYQHTDYKYMWVAPYEIISTAVN